MHSSDDHSGHESIREGDATTFSERNPYLLIVGCPRSGTTLLQRMLDNHPQLAVANDTHFITRALQKTAPHLSDAVVTGNEVLLTNELVAGVSAYHRFPRLGLPISAVAEAAARSRTYRDFVSALYMEFGRLHCKPLAGEKTPDYVRYLPMLHALMPWLRTVHIVRDGRDVALSTLEWADENKGPGKFNRWKEDPLPVCALWWRWHVTAGRRDGARLGREAYFEVTYENLVARTEQELRRVAMFLDVPFAPEMLAYHEGKTRSKPGRSAKSAWLPPTIGLREWRAQMPERDVALFEALAGEALVEFGYERGIEKISPAIRALADSYEEWWQAYVVTPDKRRAAAHSSTSSN